ncbi:hypothetical protein [Sphingomonas bacterium]|uniref:hypothetical protein n=1 Tax=Sphingomonas bacterium TaxID=1895847 RepID=UPI00262CCD6A|nr:hypothetical protein [Sphingomonas bacterium]MDB5680147.1 hypothetical protein [Sphingomonas bacterium]
MTRSSLRRVFVRFLLLWSVLSVQAAAASGGAYLTNPSVRLWYEGTGRLSDNIAPPRKFNLWNTIIGEGDAEEIANDALFTIDLRSDGQQNIREPITLTATDLKGKILASRILPGLLTSRNGTSTVALWVKNVGCAGTVVFTAKMGMDKRLVKLDFSCGE